MEEGGFKVVERCKAKQLHQTMYWWPKREEHCINSGASNQDIDMLDNSSNVVPFQPSLPLGSKSPIPPPSESPRIPDNIQRKLAAIEVEFAEIIGDASIDLIAEADLIANNNSIIHVSHTANL